MMNSYNAIDLGLTSTTLQHNGRNKKIQSSLKTIAVGILFGSLCVAGGYTVASGKIEGNRTSGNCTIH